MRVRGCPVWSVLAAVAVVATLAVGAGAGSSQPTYLVDEARRLTQPGGWHSALQAVLRPDLDRLESALSIKKAAALRLVPFFAALLGSLGLLRLRRPDRVALAGYASPWLARARQGTGLRAPPASAQA